MKQPEWGAVFGIGLMFLSAYVTLKFLKWAWVMMPVWVGR
jgi:hypothetical protein